MACKQSMHNDRWCTREILRCICGVIQSKDNRPERETGGERDREIG